MIFQDEVAATMKLCQVCGCRGPLSCGKCKSVNYCGASHQKIDWTLGEHKSHCKPNETFSKIGNEKHKYLLEEFELSIDQEQSNGNENDVSESEQEKDERRMKDYEEYVKENQQSDLKDVPVEEFEKYTSQVDDAIFSQFKKRIETDPEQVDNK